MSNDNGTTSTPQPQPEDRPEPKKGGFGAFAQQYRDRWADGHPGAKPAKPATPPADVPPRPADDAGAPDTGTQP